MLIGAMSAKDPVNVHHAAEASCSVHQTLAGYRPEKDIECMNMLCISGDVKGRASQQLTFYGVLLPHFGASWSGR